MKLVLGTVQFGQKYGVNNRSGQVTETEMFRILDAAWEAGLRTLDTAEAYGNACDRIGNYHRGRNHRFHVMSKFRIGSVTGSLQGHVSEQLHCLDVPALDALYFHRFEEFRAFRTIDEVNALLDRGQVERMGVSLHSDASQTGSEVVEAIEAGWIRLIQLPLNLLDHWRFRGPAITRAASSGIDVYARSAFLQGLFFMEKAPERLAALAGPLQSLRSLSLESGVAIGELALRYALSFEPVDGVLIGVESVEHLHLNLDWASRGRLDPELLERVAAIGAPDERMLNPANWPPS